MRQLIFSILTISCLSLTAQDNYFNVKLKVRNAFNLKRGNAFAILYEDFLPIDTIRVNSFGVSKFKIQENKNLHVEVQQENYYPILVSFNTETSGYAVKRYELFFEVQQFPVKGKESESVFQLPMQHYLFNPYQGKLMAYRLFNSNRFMELGKWEDEKYKGFPILRKDDSYKNVLKDWSEKKSVMQAKLITKGLTFVNSVDSAEFKLDRQKWLAKFIQPEIVNIDTVMKQLEMEENIEILEQVEDRYSKAADMDSLESIFKNSMEEIYSQIRKSDTLTSTNILEEESKLFKMQTGKLTQSLKNEFEKEKYEQEVKYRDNIVNNMKGKSRILKEVADSQRTQRLKELNDKK